ncbi:MAG: hypothetical protein J5I91_05680 [Bacteroidetes bacterium]|nr:hypothetical protein [Bacteroidota bacterium]
MKRFLVKIALLTLIVFASAYPLDKLISHWLKKSNSFAVKEYPVWNDILNGKLNSDIWIYGSSRAWTQFDPDILQDSLYKPVYNLGIDGLPFPMQYFRHSLALKYNKRPRIIIQSVDFGTLTRRDLYNADQFLPYMLWDNDFYDAMHEYKGFNKLDYKIPFLRYYGNYPAFKEAISVALNPGKNKATRVRGYQGQDLNWNDDLERAKAMTDYYRFVIDNGSVKLFHQFLEECSSAGIKVVLVYSPIYIEGQEFIEGHKNIVELYKEIATKHNCRFIDFTKDSICYEKKYFYNSLHLNKTGAELFTQKLGSMIKDEL